MNDTLGHDYGDLLLERVASRLKETVRPEDTVARLGGDEFVVMLPHIDTADDASLVAGKLLHAVAGTYKLGEQIATVGTSVGIAVFPEHGTTAAELTKSADSALYRAKAAGKGRYAMANGDDIRRRATVGTTQLQPRNG